MLKVTRQIGLRRRQKEKRGQRTTSIDIANKIYRSNKSNIHFNLTRGTLTLHWRPYLYGMHEAITLAFTTDAINPTR